MNRNVVIVLAGGFLIAVLVALLVQASLSGGSKQPEAAPVAVREEPRVEILVAARDLAVGDRLSNENMRWHEWPRAGVFPGAVVRKDDESPADALSGRLKDAISLGDPVIKTALVGDQSNLLSASLREGMRAVSIDVNASAVVAGFVGPGDYVDIVLTYNERIRYDGDDPEIQALIESAINRMASETIMENVRVLAVDQTSQRAEDERARVGRTVTLEVDRRGAETLALARRMGDLSLVLRGLGDEIIVTERGPVVTDARLTRVRDELFEEIEKKENSAGNRSNIVRVYMGGMMQEVSVAP